MQIVQPEGIGSKFQPFKWRCSASFSTLCGLKDMWKLDLSNNNLTDDSMPHCLFDDLSYLESLDLSGNNLKNSHHILSALCRLQNLKRLDLSDNFLDDGSIPTCLFENHSVLESLDISHNNIRGSPGFFSGICKLRNLQVLNLQDNLIQGGLDPCLGGMTSLVSLDLSFNHFEGTFFLHIQQPDFARDPSSFR
ncbi:protein flightless-1 isoform X3 [Solanum tuberosum]|nr:PREDICTED: protein flightless-1 isoform X3 [Solanum tuberosum]